MSPDPFEPLPAADPEFVAALQAGDSAAWERFNREYGSWLRRILQGKTPRKTQPRFDLDDVVQTALAEAALRMPTFQYRDEERFRGFLKRLATSKLQDHLRRATRSVRTVYAEGPGLNPAMVPATRSDNRTPSSIFSRHEVSRDLFAAIAGLDRQDQELLWSRIIDEQPYKELAKAWGVTIDAVRHKILAILKLLEERIRSHDT